jgi:hypothetical protein
MFYVIIPNALAYPTEIDLPTGKSEMNDTEFRNPKHFSQQRLNKLISRKVPLTIYADLATAVKAVNRLAKEQIPAPSHASGILCLPTEERGVRYIISEAGASGQKTVTWALESTPVINTLCFWSVAPILEPHLGGACLPVTIEEKAFDLLIFDDYAQLWQVCNIVGKPAPRITSEKKLISACDVLNIAKITESIDEIIAEKFSITSVPLVFLLTKVVKEDLISSLKVAITLLIIQGEHPCVYMDEVYDSLYMRIGKLNQTWLPHFLDELVEALRMGCFNSRDYNAFLKNAKAGKVEDCFAFIQKGVDACRTHKKAALRFSFLKPEGTASVGSVSTVSIEDALSTGSDIVTAGAGVGAR